MKCDQCNGEAFVDCHRCAGNGFTDQDQPWCTTCDGEGSVECPKCDGSGRIGVEPTDDPIAAGCTDALTLMDDEQRAAATGWLKLNVEQLRRNLARPPLEFDPDRLTLISAGVYLDDGRLPLDDAQQSADRMVVVVRFDTGGQLGANTLTMKGEVNGCATPHELGAKLVEARKRQDEGSDDG